MKQRRVMDKWGRMMLLQPNRNYFKNKSNVYYTYHKYDYLDKLFAMSMLDDEDQEDLVLPGEEYKEQLVESIQHIQG